MNTETTTPPIDMYEEEYKGRLIAVSREPLGVGQGKAHAEITSFEEALELSRLAADCVGDITLNSTDCGDGREFAKSGSQFLGNTSTIEGLDRLICPTLFGGSVNSSLGMKLTAEGVSAFHSYEEFFANLADQLTSLGEQLGAHTDSHADPKKQASHCGSLDGADTVYEINGSLEYAEALEPFVEYLQVISGYGFDKSVYRTHSGNSNRIANSQIFNSWSGQKGVDLTLEKGGLVRVLEAGDSNTLAHNHRESLITVVMDRNQGLDKERFNTESGGRQTFTLTPWKLRDYAKAFAIEASTRDMEKSISDLYQAGLLFQMGHALVVPDGTQYLTIIR